MSTKTNPKREILLLLVGALISVLTAFLTNTFNARQEDIRFNLQKKLEFNKQISEDLGKRLFLSRELYRAEKNKDSIQYTLALTRYRNSKEDWNIKIYTYLSLLDYYYGKSTKEKFVTTIFNPLVEYGQKAEKKQTENLFEQTYVIHKNNNVAFISKLYTLAED